MPRPLPAARAGWCPPHRRRWRAGRGWSRTRARVVQVHQVDAAGDRLDPLHRGGEVPTCREGVTGVQAETGAELADLVPQPGQHVELPGHGAVAARGVLDQYRHTEPALGGLAFEQLAPVGQPVAGVLLLAHVPAVHDQAARADLARHTRVGDDLLARGNADAVVQRGDVEHVGRMDEYRHPRRSELGGTFGRLRLVPFLRVGEEELHNVRTNSLRGRQRFLAADMSTDQHTPRLPAPRNLDALR